MRLIKTMDFSSNQGRVCQLRHSNSTAIASICNAESAEKTRFKVANRVKHYTRCLPFVVARRLARRGLHWCQCERAFCCLRPRYWCHREAFSPPIFGAPGALPSAVRVMARIKFPIEPIFRNQAQGQHQAPGLAICQNFVQSVKRIMP